MENDNIIIETHPWPPFVPPHAKVLIMGTFPPGSHRWSIRIFSILILSMISGVSWDCSILEIRMLYDAAGKVFRLDDIKRLINEHGIAMGDTGYKIRRLKGNASDKYLEILEPVDLRGLLARMPDCHTVATTGEKAATVVAQITDTDLPKMGSKVVSADGLTIWRMPSTSRAYPLALGA